MARPLGGHAGGILSLDVLIQEHSEAIEFDLIDRGLRLRQLGTDALTWRDLKVIIQHCPAKSALSRAMYPDHGWGLAEQLQAALLDKVNWLVWAKTKDGQSGRNRPKPIPRPGVEDEEKIGTTVMSIPQMDAFLGYSMRR